AEEEPVDGRAEAGEKSRPRAAPVDETEVEVGEVDASAGPHRVADGDDVIRGGGLLRADRPYRLIGDDDATGSGQFAGDGGHGRADLSDHLGRGRFRRAFGQFTDAQDR